MGMNTNALDLDLCSENARMASHTCKTSSQRIPHWNATVAIDQHLCSENARLKNEDVIKHGTHIPYGNARNALDLYLCSENARMTLHKCKKSISGKRDLG